MKMLGLLRGGIAALRRAGNKFRHAEKMGVASQNEDPHKSCETKEKDREAKKMDTPGIEPGTAPMLKENYTTKPCAQVYACDC